MASGDDGWGSGTSGLTVMPSYSGPGQAEIEHFGHQVYMRLSAAQAKTAMAKYASRSVTEINIAIAIEGTQAIEQLTALQLQPGRNDLAQERINHFIKGLGAGYVRQMQVIAAEFGDGLINALNAPYKVYEVAKYIETLPVEKREGIFRKIGRFLFGD